MAILVTGAAGFIGMHSALRLVARGEQVIGIDNLNDYYSVQLKRDRVKAIEDAAREGPGSFRFAACDFADHAALDTELAGETIDRIVHLGAQAGIRYSLDNPRAYAQSNLVGQTNMLELARCRQVAHMVYASSSSVYGGNTTLPFRVEDRTDQPISFYAATKKAAELMGETYAHLYALPLTGLRFFTVYGPWGRPDMALWLFTDAILRGQPISVFNDGVMRRDFTYIDDIVSGVVAALDRPPANDRAEKAGGSHSCHAIYNIGNNQSEYVGSLIDLIERACGKPAIRVMKPIQPGDIKDTFADISAIKRDLGFSAVTSLEQGVPRFVEWFRSYHGV